MYKPILSYLTAPSDRADTIGTVIDPSVDDLTPEQTKAAMNELYHEEWIKKFPQVDRFYTDTPYNGQIYCMHSFVPSKGATPDKNGLFGFIKCRGTFLTDKEAQKRAKDIIRTTDSYHEIYTSYCGRPFPIGVDVQKYVKETDTVEIKKQAVELISEDIKQKKEEEKQEIEDIKRREQELMKQSSAAERNEPMDPMDEYIMTQVKKANLVFTYVRTQEKLAEMRKSIRSAYKRIHELDEIDKTLMDKYHDRYMQARRDAKLPDIENDQENWMKYLCEDFTLDFSLDEDE